MIDDLIKGFIAKHTPPAISILLTIVLGIYYIGHEVKTGFDDVKGDIIYESRAPYYLDKEYSLRKQLEKLESDPSDLKTTDVELVYMICSSEFGLKYIPSLPANRKINAEKACEKMSNLYISRNVY